MLPLNITGNGTLLNTPGNTAFADLNGSNTVLGGLGPGQLYFDPNVYTLPVAGVQGNMKRNGGPEGPGFWQLDTSLFKRFSVGGTPLRRVPRRRVQHDQLGALGQPGHGLQRRHRQHVRPDHRDQRLAAQPEVRRKVRVLGGFRVRGSGFDGPWTLNYFAASTARRSARCTATRAASGEGLPKSRAIWA